MQNPIKPFGLAATCLLLFGGDLVTPPTQAKVAQFTLGQLVRASSIVIIGHVESMSVVNGLKVAKVAVSETLKGSGTTPTLYVVAEGTGPCDVSAALSGEHALLFLSPVPGDRVDRALRRKPSVTVPLNPLYSISYAGRGRMPLCVLGSELYVSEIGIGLPRGIKTLPSKDNEMEYASLGRSLPFHTIRALVMAEIATERE